ncbi:anion exchange family protein [Cordyceps fumosorosea ARSEF 2679]|uniref:Anion exchange family protein n=1 Tax=Cordyceps fumosorosea (strain ARSEF 2679) TaxID=1081104 RepID=A0A167ZLU6_CORFA|nr:anion exchange family protein [Cordyceps fumosorosea ARSEF 2679]OAA67670.1 anion exchange family protein [Cordyceps fumosorosea ARSEF 2679]
MPATTSAQRPEDANVLPVTERQRTFQTPSSPAAKKSKGKTAWWRIHLFRGMVNDVHRRGPYYVSDWTDAWDYRVVPATVYMYFANILPALAFSLDMFQSTASSYGVNEVLLSSVLGAVVFALAAAQPLVIVGVTGPITVFNYTVYDIIHPTGVDYLGFMAWIGIWSLILHWILAVTNSCNWLRWVTRFPCDIFGFYVACIYLQKGVQVLDRLGHGPDFYLSLVVALLVFLVAYACSMVADSNLFRHQVRVFLKDYGTPLTLIFFTGFVHIGRMREVPLQRLPTGIAFEPTTERSWLVRFWELGVGDVFTALPFAILLTILFWFDHNGKNTSASSHPMPHQLTTLPRPVSSLIAQGSEFPLRKPAGFHWDLFLLGLTTGVAGLLGLPFPNGLIPQAPFHTASLCVTQSAKPHDNDNDSSDLIPPEATTATTIATHVVEQRASNLAQGLLTLGTMTGPLLVVLHLVPQAVLAGLFFIMGVQALADNGITAKLAFLARDRHARPPAADAPLRAIKRRAAVWWFVTVELVAFAATFAITQTVAAVGFPVFILALIPVRALVLPQLFHPDELARLDAPTASAFTMEGIGGSWGGGSSEPGGDSMPPQGEKGEATWQPRVSPRDGGVVEGDARDVSPPPGSAFRRRRPSSAPDGGVASSGLSAQETGRA